jgi:hypothetical protein
MAEREAIPSDTGAVGLGCRCAASAGGNRSQLVAAGSSTEVWCASGRNGLFMGCCAGEATDPRRCGWERLEVSEMEGKSGGDMFTMQLGDGLVHLAAAIEIRGEQAVDGGFSELDGRAFADAHHGVESSEFAVETKRGSVFGSDDAGFRFTQGLESHNH